MGVTNTATTTTRNMEVDVKLVDVEEKHLEKKAKATAKDIRYREKLKQLGDPDAPSKVIIIRHIPFGFFERELLKYFQQFGRVRRVRVARNLKSGNFKGWAFVSFTDNDVAQIAAETMDGYIMFEKKLICKVLKNGQVPRSMLSGPRLMKAPIKGTTARRNTRLQSKRKTEAQIKKNQKRLIGRLNKKKEQLATIGFNYLFDIPSFAHCCQEAKKEEPKAEAEVIEIEKPKKSPAKETKSSEPKPKKKKLLMKSKKTHSIKVVGKETRKSKSDLKETRKSKDLKEPTKIKSKVEKGESKELKKSVKGKKRPLVE